jgi:hypothetical protein
MSVALTESAVVDRTKTVTRRLGWLMLKRGDVLTLCRKVMGRKPGEPLVRIVDVEVVSVIRQRLDQITARDVRREGFPEMTPGEFVEFFCRTHKGCTPETEVTRIKWQYPEWICGEEKPGSTRGCDLPQYHTGDHAETDLDGTVLNTWST